MTEYFEAFEEFTMLFRYSDEAFNEIFSLSISAGYNIRNKRLTCHF